MKITSPWEVAAQIARLEEKLGTLRRLEGAMTGGRISASARQQRDRDEEIRSDYLESEGVYGVLKNIAENYGLSERHVRRILRAGGVKRDTVADILSRDPPASGYSEPSAEPARASSRSADCGAVNPAEPDFTQPDDAEDLAVISPEQFFDGARILIKSMHRLARGARIPGKPRIDRMAALQLVESLANDWDELVMKLSGAVDPRRRLRDRKSAPSKSHKRTRIR